MKNLINFFVLPLFLFFASCTIYNEAEDIINVQVVTADLTEIVLELKELKDMSSQNHSTVLLKINSVQNDVNKLIAQGELTKNDLLLIRRLLEQMNQLVLEIALIQQKQDKDITEMKHKLLENYLLLMSISNDLKDLKNWTLENKNNLIQLISLFGGLENMQNIILQNLISQGNLQNQIFEKIQVLTLHMRLLQESVDTWGSLILSNIEKLGLTQQQQGITLANILANTQNLLKYTREVIAKLEQLQLTANNLKLTLISMVDQLHSIKKDVKDLKAVVNSIFTQVMLLHDSNLEILIEIRNKFPEINIYNSYEYVFNEYVDNSTNISQIYNACSNGVGSCGNGLIPPSNVCMVLNMMNPYIQGNNNNVNYNFGSLNTNAGNISNNFGC